MKRYPSALILALSCTAFTAASAQEFAGLGAQLGAIRGQAQAQKKIPQRPKTGGLRADLDALARRLASEHPEIPSAAVRKAFQYYMTGSARNKEYVAIVDFDLPSTARRLKIIGIRDGSVESYLVAHGQGSGELYATRFSDKPRSRKSALGIYLTGKQYDGEHGRSLMLLGMEATNSHALQREIDMHAAEYVSDAVAARGMIGRSWGCPAIDYKHRDHIINELMGGAVLLAYSAQPGT